MRYRFVCFLIVIILFINCTNVLVGAVNIKETYDIEGHEKDFLFYTRTAELISEYWEDDYFDSISYTEDYGASIVDGEWYVSIKTFCGDTGVNYARSGKKVVLSTDELSWEFKIDKSSSVLNGEKYNFNYKPIKKNGRYMISADEIDGNMCFDIREDESGITITRPYQLRRLIVETNGKKIYPGSYGAVKYVKNGNTYILQFDTEKDTELAYKDLSSKKKIVSVEPDRLISMIEPENILKGRDQAIPGTYGDAYDWNVTMIGSDILASKIEEAGLSEKVLVAIVDTGIDYNHSFLMNNVVSKGYDFVNNDYDAYDDNGHGTHVAGIVKSVVCGASVELLPIKVLSGQGSGTSLSVSNGIIYSAECGADVINLSLGGASYGSSHYEDQAIQKAISLGSVVVVAAGNDNYDTAYECPAHNDSVIVVSAIDSEYNKAYFSNYGKSVDVAAPGVDITSSVPGDAYESWSGTSMATPHISGLAALLRIINPNADNAEIEKKLRACAVDLGSSGYDVYYGYGVPYVGDIEVDENEVVTTDPTVTPVPTMEPDTPTATPVTTWEPDIPTATPTVQPTTTPIEIPTWTPVWPTDTPWWPTYAPTSTPAITSTPSPTSIPVISVTPKPTSVPVITTTPTPTSVPVITTAPTPTNIPVITSVPTPPVITTPPIYTGNISCNISSSSSYVNGQKTVIVNIVTGDGIAKVVVKASDGTNYEIINEGSGINKKINISGNGITYEIKAYDYSGNLVSSSMG